MYVKMEREKKVIFSEETDLYFARNHYISTDSQFWREKKQQTKKSAYFLKKKIVPASSIWTPPVPAENWPLEADADEPPLTETPDESLVNVRKSIWLPAGPAKIMFFNKLY